MKKYNIADQFKNSHRKEMPQTSDYVFRMLYGQDTEESHNALIAVLNIVLDRKDDPIRKIVVKNPIILGNSENGKDVLMDIRAETDSGELLDIEMQSGHLIHYPERSVYYGGKLVVSGLQTGEEYGKLRKSIVVSFIDGVLFPDLEGCHHVFQLLKKDHGRLLSDRLSICFVELGKADPKREVSELTPAERLAAYMKYAADEEQADYIERILAEEEELIMAETLYRKLTQDEIAYEEMETRIRTEFARNTELCHARREGRLEGEILLSKLTARLLADDRIEDLKRAAEDEAYRAELYEEYGLEINSGKERAEQNGKEG